jgi:hypothetical protein
MGSLPPQGLNSNQAPVTNEDETLSVSNSYLNKFTIDSRMLNDSVITIFNADNTEQLSYKIYATAQGSDIIPANSDNSWVNIIDREVDNPTLYDHNKERTIPPLGIFYESFTNKWSWIRIMMKSGSGTISAKIWHRGVK